MPRIVLKVFGCGWWWWVAVGIYFIVQLKSRLCWTRLSDKISAMPLIIRILLNTSILKFLLKINTRSFLLINTLFIRRSSANHMVRNGVWGHNWDKNFGEIGHFHFVGWVSPTSLTNYIHFRSNFDNCNYLSVDLFVCLSRDPEAVIM